MWEWLVSGEVRTPICQLSSLSHVRVRFRAPENNYNSNITNKIMKKFQILRGLPKRVTET